MGIGDSFPGLTPGQAARRGELRKVSLQREGDQMPRGFTLEKLTDSEGLTLSRAHFQGTSGWRPALPGELFCWCDEGG